MPRYFLLVAETGPAETGLEPPSLSDFKSMRCGDRERAPHSDLKIKLAARGYDQ
jgi:hypothetical protein